MCYFGTYVSRMSPAHITSSKGIHTSPGSGAKGHKAIGDWDTRLCICVTIHPRTGAKGSGCYLSVSKATRRECASAFIQMPQRVAHEGACIAKGVCMLASNPSRAKGVVSMPAWMEQRGQDGPWLSGLAKVIRVSACCTRAERNSMQACTPGQRERARGMASCMHGQREEMSACILYAKTGDHCNWTLPACQDRGTNRGCSPVFPVWLKSVLLHHGSP